MFLFTDYLEVEFRYTVIGKLYIFYVGFIFFINFLLISIGMTTDILKELKKQRHKREWENFYLLKEKMAKFIVYSAMKQKPFLVTYKGD